MVRDISVYIPGNRDICRYIPDHKVFNAKAALYIAHTNSPLIMGLYYEILASFEDLLKPITSDKKTYGRYFE